MQMSSRSQEVNELRVVDACQIKREETREVARHVAKTIRASTNVQVSNEYYHLAKIPGNEHRKQRASP